MEFTREQLYKFARYYKAVAEMRAAGLVPEDAFAAVDGLLREDMRLDLQFIASNQVALEAAARAAGLIGS